MYRAGFARPTFASEGEKALSKHSATAKHRKAWAAEVGSWNLFHVYTAQDAKPKEERSTEDKAKEAELIYLHHVGAHGIPPHVAKCTTQLVKDMFTDSKIAQKFSFSHSKQGYGITYGLGPHYNDELTSGLKIEHFSINIDESTVLKTNQLAISVRYFHQTWGKVVTEHYKTVNIGKKDAESLVRVLDQTFKEVYIGRGQLKTGGTTNRKVVQPVGTGRDWSHYRL